MVFKRFIKYVLPKKVKLKILNYLDQDYIVVDYWSSKINNFGDELTPFILSKITFKEIINIQNKKFFHKKVIISFIGSILSPNSRLNKKKIVLGSGIIDFVEEFNYGFKKVYFVRGPLTREILLNNMIDCPELYCDPGLLLPFFYKPEAKIKKYKLGVIPHYVDKPSIKFMRLLKNFNEDVLSIDIQENIKDVINDICSCEIIASSSLHGLIVADAYNIPTCWIEFSENVIGNGFKFNDYYLSLGHNLVTPTNVENLETLDYLINSATTKNIENIDYGKIFETISEALKENDL